MNALINLLKKFWKLFSNKKQVKHTTDSLSDMLNEEYQIPVENDIEDEEVSIKSNLKSESLIDLELEPLEQEIEKDKTTIEFPIILKPISENEFSLLYEHSVDYKKGLVEDILFIELWNLFQAKISNQVVVQFDDIKYVPDIAIIDFDNKMFIDIEIDEPYTHEKNKVIPIHFAGDDEVRNNTFTKSGWNVIRFSEEQVVRYPLDCIQLIKGIIYSEEYNFNFKHEVWDRNQSLLFEKNDFRNSYLELIGKKYTPSDKIEVLKLKHYYQKIYNITPIFSMPDGSYRVGIIGFNEKGNESNVELFNKMEFYCNVNILCKKIIVQLFPNHIESQKWMKFLDDNPNSKSTLNLFVAFKKNLIRKSGIIVKVWNPENKSRLSLNYDSDFRFVFNSEIESNLIQKVQKYAYLI